jgi:pimeloyl-ACP methyl ester carboxylesterase
MVPLASAGFHVVAPDQRGYRRTTGWDAKYDGDLGSFRILNAVRDALGLVSALGYRDVAMVAGHDSGASVAAWCSLVRPDVFHSVALMSAPSAGPPTLPFDTADYPTKSVLAEYDIHDELELNKGSLAKSLGISETERAVSAHGTELPGRDVSVWVCIGGHSGP